MATGSVKLGYKQTEIGTIPDDWDVDEIQKHADITTGSRNTQDRIEDGRFPFFVRSQQIERIDTYSFDGEAVLTAGDGVGTGKVFHYINGKFDFHQRVYKISNFDSRLDGYFFYLYFSNYFLARIMSMTAKSSVDSVRRDMVAEMLIPIPEMAEQIAIRETIKDTMELIETLDELIEKKKNIKQGAMQELLSGRRRLPGFTGKWEMKSFEDVMDGFTSGQTPSRARPEYYKGNIPWITSGELNYNRITDTIEKITPDAVRDTNLKVIPEGTFLFAITGLEAEGTRGSCAIAGIEATTNQSCMALYPKDGLLTTSYLFHYYVEFGKRLALVYCQGTKQQSYTGATARLLPIMLPPTIEEQSAIAQVLSDMDAEIGELESVRKKYFMVKKGMMQQLLTGSILLQ